MLLVHEPFITGVQQDKELVPEYKFSILLSKQFRWAEIFLVARLSH